MVSGQTGGYGWMGGQGVLWHGWDGRERLFIDGYGWSRGMGGLVEWVGLLMGTVMVK